MNQSGKHHQHCYDGCDTAPKALSTMILKAIPGLSSALMLSLVFTTPTLANIKDEFERAQACDYTTAEFISDVRRVR